MSDLQLLFAVLLALYVWECVCWLPRGTVALRTSLGRRWTLTLPGALFGNARGGVVLAFPFPPLGTFHTAGPLPLWVSPTGVAPRLPVGAQTPDDTGWVTFEQLGEVRASHKKVRRGKELLVRAPSASWAARMAALLNHWRHLAPEEVTAAVREFTRQSMDLGSIEARLAQVRGDLKRLQALANWLVLYLFALAPLITWRFGLRHSWPWLLAGLLVLTVTIALAFRRAHARVYPDLADERFTHSLTILLSPANAARAHDLFSRPLLEAWHPVAVARHLCDETEFRRVAAETWRDLSYPAGGAQSEANSPALLARQHTREILRQELEGFLGRQGVDVNALLSPPVPADDSSMAYCPRCLAQFVSTGMYCADCPGVRVVPFGKTP